ncbi:MAG: leucine-rich repeat domain-containing protein [Ruminococcus sp.]|nr:leucine-rich repeat domain-containing protein [Ruminococcus sp.]
MRISEKGVLINYHDDPNETRLVIPEGVTAIAPHALYGAEYLEEVVIPEGVTKIGASAFENCRELRRVTMADSVTSMGKMVFGYCPKLEQVRLSCGLTEIPARAFTNCYALCSVEIPDSVQRIDIFAFNSCTALSSMRLPETLTEICDGAFMETFSLKSIDIPYGVSALEQDSFFRSGVEVMKWRGMDLYFSDGRENILNCIGIFFAEQFTEKLEQGELDTSLLDKELEIPFVVAYYVKTRSAGLKAYIKKHFPEIFKRVIRTNDLKALTAFIEEGGLISAHNIDRYIDFALECEKREIYLTLIQQKEQLGSYREKSGRFKL